MRGTDGLQESLFTIAKLDDFVPYDHELCVVRDLVNGALKRTNSLFERMCGARGRESIAPGKMRRALACQVH